MTTDADFYALELLLDDQDRALLHRVHSFMEQQVLPIINRYWTRARFPHELLPGLAELGIAGLPYTGYGCPGKSPLLDGMARMELLGAFGLTEPEVGSGVSRGLATSARRDGDAWVLEGHKKWIGNASFADLTVIWAKDVEDGQVKGFLVEAGTPGFTTENLEDKIALRVVQNALITLEGVRVPETNRLQAATSFRDTAEVLKMTRAGVAWMAVGCARGAYEHALAYACERQQFGRPIGGFQLVQDLLVRMLGNITASASLCARLSQLQAAGLARDEHASLAKAFCTVRMRETVGWARELLGGNGILLEHHVGRFVADAEAIYSYEGTREINTLIVGRAITGLSAFV